jgi:RimJ/RimL family protein N-acetyltransferase
MASKRDFTDAAAWEPVTLEGRYVRLEPIGLQHAADLYQAGQPSEIWTYMPREPFTSLEDTIQWIEETLRDQETRPEWGFTIVHRHSGLAIGSTRYWQLLFNGPRAVEIGYTWLTPSHWRTAVNTESKYLLLRHVFEHLGVLRVQLMTDTRNERSQRAIERLGAVQEGVLRCHRIPPDGYRRNSVVYSLIDEEWPAAKSRLETALNRS